MRMTPEEIEAAKRALAKLTQSPEVTTEDIALLKKYPRHTLEQAREIDSAAPWHPGTKPGETMGITSGFEKIRAQEHGIHLSGNHT